MKTSKKILSIALVLMMALNVFAISANAVLDPNHFMNEPGKYHTVDHSLSRGDEEAWVGIELAAEHPSTTNLNDIKAGDIVRLTMKSRVNFYAQTLKVFFYYDFFAFTPCLKNGTIPSAAMNGRVAYESFRDKNYYYPLSANETGAGLKFDSSFLCGWVETLEKRVSDWRPIYFTDEMAAIYNYVTVVTISNSDYSFMGYTTLNDDSGELETMDYIFASVSFKAREDIQPGSYKFFTWDQYPAEAAIIDYNKNGNYDVRDGGRIGGYAKINLIPGMEEITVTVQGAAEPVDFSALNTLIDEFDGRTDSATYTTASWATYAAAVDAGRLVAANADATQDAVDAAALAINNAKAALVEIVYANYTALDEALALVPAYAPEFYTAETIGAFNDAMAAGASVDRNLTDADQATVDAAATAINAAFAALALKGADYSALVAALAKTPAHADSNYTIATITAFNDAKANGTTVLNANYTILEQETVNAAVASIDAAYAALTLKDANYSALNDALALTPGYVDAFYTEETIDAFRIAVATALAVQPNLTILDQATIDAAAASIVTAYNALTLKAANYAALNTALALAPAYADAYYTEATISAFNTAKADGNAVAKDLTILNQATIDAAVAAINAAFAALELKAADYTALDAALALTVADPSAYTASSISAFNDAKAAGAAVAKNLKINDQAVIDAAAKAITDAFAALKLIGDSSIIDITPTVGGEYAGPIGQSGDVNFTVNNATMAPSKLLLTNTATNSTLTFDRAHSRVSIVDNGNGTETWTITLSLPSAEANYDVKVKFGNKWEDASFNFTLKAETPKVTDPATAVKTFAAEYQTVRGQNSAFTATVANDVKSLQLVRGDGATMTFANNTAGVTVVDNGDGTATWTISKALNFYGEAQYTLKFKLGSTWHDSGLTADVKIVKA